MIKTIGTIPAEKLLGMQIDLFTKLRSGALTIHQFEMFLKKQNPFMIPTAVTLGASGTQDALEDLDFKGLIDIKKEVWNMTLKPEFVFSAHTVEVNLAIITARDLGFERAVTRDEIYERATSADFNYSLCPPEVGLQLRLRYLNQPKGESLAIAMESIKVYKHGSDNILGVSNCNTSGPPELKTYDGNYDRVWELDDMWVFLRPS